MAEEFSIRLATIDDMKKVFELSNDDVVRANSINQEKIKWEDHVKWFEKRIARIDEPFYIVESTEKEFIAQVRFDKKEDVIISISITEQFRGKGLAPKIIEKCVKKTGFSKVVAYVYDTNIASIKTFVNAGFEKDNLVKFIYNPCADCISTLGGGG